MGDESKKKLRTLGQGNLVSETAALIASAQPDGVGELARPMSVEEIFAVPERAGAQPDGRSILEGIANAKMVAPAPAAPEVPAVPVVPGTPGIAVPTIARIAPVVALPVPTSGEELDRVIAEIMTAEGLSVPRFARNYVTDNDRSPEAVSIIGRTNHPYSGFDKFGYYQHDRALHTHIIGRTGGGKSTLLENIVYQDIWFGRGGMYVDPHGDSAERMLHHIPPWRIKDTIYIDFGDKENLVGLNALEIHDVTSPEERQDAVDSVVDLLRRAVSLDDNAVRLMKYLQKGLMSLAFVPEPGTTHSAMTPLEVMHLFTNATFRESVKRCITDRTLRDWWAQSFESMATPKIVDETQSLENRLSPILNDIYLTGVLGQNRTTLDLVDIMDSGKFIIVNLSKSNTSDTFRKMVGSILVSKVLKAALGRQRRMSESERLRFSLVIDEFQNFVTKDFATILEEARKYGLSLTVAHQSMGQLDDEPKLIKSLGTNIGNRLVYGVGAEDAKKLTGYMDPLSEKDVRGLPKHHIAAKLMINGEPNFPAFSAITLPPMKMLKSHDRIADIVTRRSIELYTTPSATAAKRYEDRKNLGTEVLESLGNDDGEFVVL